MSAAEMVELAAAAALLVAGILVYRRGGTQGGVLLLAIGAILLIHGLGLLDYRPAPSERTP
jgi:hypothetical protein